MMEIEWWKNKISEEIYDTLRAKEQNLPPYHGHSPQLWFRRHLVDWLAIVVETFSLGTTSQHLAIHLLDFFMDKLEVDQNHLYLLAMACLSISGIRTRLGLSFYLNPLFSVACCLPRINELTF